jgi:acetyltransferase-like isoleucine patch superfamily enzyme
MKPPAPQPRSLRDYSWFGLAMLAFDRALAAMSVASWTLWTRLLLKLLGHRCGSQLRVDGRLIVRAPRRGAIQLGNQVRVNSRRGSNLVGLTNRTIFQCLGTGQIQIGNQTGCSGVVLSSRSSIRIGDRVRLGGNVRVFDHDYHALDYMARRDSASDQAACRTAPVVIGDDVLIGTNAIILKGVTIGDRSIIGAGSVVTLKNIPPDSIVAGNPARLLQRGR